ncbi:ATP-binding protein [Methylobacterium oryzihabitans]|uniref:ATP-binding protein n=2 Tax=Methylobacterium oryzihabitans TaxID=2499852 RepID=A0A437P898_9HYPH|nr:ATP-binding protein [Methylobacterium oryzihabitans]
MFLGQTFVKSLRDVGYTNTITAVCEHVDNAVQWGAKEIRVYFRQNGLKSNSQTDVIVWDNGDGMDRDVLRVAMSFGGSMVYDRRKGIGRYGVGMKTAALSMGPAFEVYTWQEPGAIYATELDTVEIGNSRSSIIEVPDPHFETELPPEIVAALTEYMTYPKRDKQHLIAEDEEDLVERLGSSGTIVYIPRCDRLSFKLVQTLCDHATRDMARVYRRQLAKGLRLFVNNRLVEAFDPTYWMPKARHTKIPNLKSTRSRLIQHWTIPIPVEADSKITAPASVRLYALPIEDWQPLPPKVHNNDLRVFDPHQVSFVRNEREVDIRPVPEIGMPRHAETHWMRVQIDFDGRLDEALGVAMTKQGVRPKQYALELIHHEIAEAIRSVRNHNKKVMADGRRSRSTGKLAEAERRARNADAFRDDSFALTEEEEAELDRELRAMAVLLKRFGETEDQAYERIKASRYIVTTKHDDHWPFYALDYRCGRIVLTINTAHPFYTRLYQPLAELEGEDRDAADNGSEPIQDGELLVALQLMLLSLAAAQTRLMRGSDRNKVEDLFRDLQRDWSETLKKQLEFG